MFRNRRNFMIFMNNDYSDAAPCHTVEPAMAVLRSMFGDRIINNKSHICQPADSPDF